jgi:hypothetical protein
MKTTATLASALFIMTGCVGGPTEDGRDDSFGDDKADSGKVAEGSRQAKGVLRVANEVSLEVLREDPPDGVGLADRPVDNIGDVRLGDDGTPGTADDGHFDTLAELDAVPFVGPIAFKKLLAYAEANGFVPRGTIVNGKVDADAQVIVYREGLTGPWQPAVIMPDHFEVEVDGPFVVLAVCEDIAENSVNIIEMGRLPDEGDITVGCATQKTGTHAITGHMVQAGKVVAGFTQRSSSVANWDFSLTVPDGTYDVVATTADSIAVRRGIAVLGSEVAVQAIDVAQEALPLVSTPLSVTNAIGSEGVTARVSLRPQTNVLSATVFKGAPADARVIVPSSLLASDLQRASITATEGPFSRSVFRTVAIGGDTSFTLPPRLPTPQWSVENGELQMRLGAMPEGEQFTVDAFSILSDRPTIFHDFEASKRFVAESGLTQVTLETTNVPGFKPEWVIDFGQEYFRDVFAEANGATESSQSVFSETINGTALRAPTRLPLARAQMLDR